MSQKTNISQKYQSKLKQTHKLDKIKIMILLLLVAKFIIDPHQTHKLLKYQIPIPKSNPPISPKSHFCSKFLPWIFSFKSTFFYSNLLIKTPSKITFLHSIHSKKKALSSLTTPQLLLYTQQQFAQLQKSLSHQNNTKKHQIPWRKSEKPPLFFQIFVKVIHNHQKKLIQVQGGMDIK